MCHISFSLFLHQTTFLLPLIIFPFLAHKCWLCGYSTPHRLSNKQSDKQTQPYEQASRCKPSSSQTSMGQTWLKSKRRRVFILAHQSPINSCFLGRRQTAGCVRISTASTIRQPTDDRTLETLLRRFGLLHTADGVLGCLFNYLFFLLPSLSVSPACTLNTHIHIHALRQPWKPEDIKAWKIICQPFTPQHQICRAATARA